MNNPCLVFEEVVGTGVHPVWPVIGRIAITHAEAKFRATEQVLREVSLNDQAKTSSKHAWRSRDVVEQLDQVP